MMAGAAAAAAAVGPAQADVLGFYANALIIDALCFGRDWDDNEFDALIEERAFAETVRKTRLGSVLQDRYGFRH